MFETKDEIEKALYAFSEQLEALKAGHYELLVCGGAALSVLGFVSLATKDVDIVAVVRKSPNSGTIITNANQLESKFFEAAERVEKDFGLPKGWINSGPSDMVQFGLPAGIMERAKTKRYGILLTIHFISRYDQIHFKLYATVDQGGGRHYNDLLVLKPSDSELEAAARWSMTHDPSEGYKMVLKSLLVQIGRKDVAERL